MKVEIVIPDALLKAAQQLAQDLNMPLSELYVAAIAAYVATHQNTADNITERLNAVYQTEPSTLDPDLMALQMASIEENTW